MTSLWLEHLGIVYTIYGLSFFVLGVVAFILPRQDMTLPFARHLWLLGLFGVQHGAMELIDNELLLHPLYWLGWLKNILLLTSYLSLLEFGRRVINASGPVRQLNAYWLYTVVGFVIVALTMTAKNPLTGYTISVRYVVGTPGAMLTGIAILMNIHSRTRLDGEAQLSNWFRLAAGAFVTYAILTLFIRTNDINFPQWLPTHADFLRWLDIPVELGRALCAALVATAMAVMVRRANNLNSEEIERMLGGITGFVYRCHNDPDWTPIYINGKVESLCGYPIERFFGKQRLSWNELVHRDDIDRTWSETQDALAARRDFELLYRIHNQAGKTCWVHERGRGIYSANDTLLYLEGHITDATSLVEANEALHIKDAAIEASLNPLAIVDIQGRHTYVNQAYVRLWGLHGSEDILGRRPDEFAEDPSEVAAVFDALQQQDQWQGQVGARRPDGTSFEVQLSASVVRDRTGTPLCIVASFLDLSALFRTEQQLRESAELLEQSQAMGNMGSWVWDITTGHLNLSDEQYRILGYEPGTTVTFEMFAERVHPDDRERVLHLVSQSVEQDKPYDTEYRICHPNGMERIIAARGVVRHDVNGKAESMYGMTQDITEQKHAELALQRTLEDLRLSEQRQRELTLLAQHEQGRMAALLSGMSFGILFEDHAHCVEYVNPAFRHMWAIPEDIALIGGPTRDVLAHSTHRFAQPNHASKHVLHVLDTHENSERYEVDLSDGRVLTQLSYPVLDPQARVIGRLWIYEDVTHERKTAEQLVYMAEHDPLTGLHNRHRFQKHLEWLIKTNKRSGIRFALLYFDLDEFKYINDTYGHRSGDAVLVRTSGEVASLVRSGEMFARLGGDEFALITELAGDDKPTVLAERITHAIAAIPFRFRGNHFRLTASVGIALFPEHGDNAEDLVAHADTAMYQAKGQGKNTWAFYDATRDSTEQMMTRMNWANRISQALEQGAFELHFQGVYRSADRQLSHVEALVRMQDATHSGQLITPGQFIPVAEKSGQILEIDRWVLRRSIETLAAHPDLSALAVNISGRSIDEPRLPQYIQQLLEQHAVAPQRLIIELTETAAVSEMQDAQHFIEVLQHTGCHVSLDDFGSGFSTFSYLKYLGVQSIKIDGMFIRDLPNNPDNQAFVRAMVDVARGLGKSTVAEFVEDEATMAMLCELGVDFAQGYHLDRPCANHPGLQTT